MASSQINIYIIKPSNGHNFVTTGRIFCGVFSFHKTNIYVRGIDWVHSRGSGINHSSKTTKKYWCSNSCGGLIIVASGKLATRTAPCRAFLHSCTILLSLFRASNISEAAPDTERAVMCVPATSVPVEKSFISGRTYCERKTINPCPTRVNKIILFTTTIVLL